MTWRCGHEETDANTTPAGRCRTCQRAYHRSYNRDYMQGRRAEIRAKLTPAERYAKYRTRYLPIQIEATERKLAMLRNEAARLGLVDLLQDRSR